MAKKPTVEQIVVHTLRSYYVHPIRNPLATSAFRAIAVAGDSILPVAGSIIGWGLDKLTSNQGKFYPSPSMIPSDVRLRVERVYGIGSNERVIGLYVDSPWISITPTFCMGLVVFTSAGIRCAPGVCIPYERFATGKLASRVDTHYPGPGIKTEETKLSLTVDGREYELGEDHNSKQAALRSLQGKFKPTRRWPWRS